MVLLFLLTFNEIVASENNACDAIEILRGKHRNLVLKWSFLACTLNLAVFSGYTGFLWQAFDF